MALASIVARPLDPDAFRPFGDVIDTYRPADYRINDGRCERFHDMARLAFANDGRAGISLFRSDASAVPYRLEMMERHPAGSQAFLPLTGSAYLVVVAEDAGGRPGALYAFLAGPHQGVNYLANTWHAPLIALSDGAVFAVVDRIGSGPNLEEATLPEPVLVSR